jgi:fluoride ion exporter CrcB/FEX
MASMRLWRIRAKIALALFTIGSLGAMPAWLIDRWVVRLDPTVSLGVCVALIWGLLALVDFTALVRRWKQEA